jgi:hypothetical protein
MKKTHGLRHFTRPTPRRQGVGMQDRKGRVIGEGERAEGKTKLGPDQKAQEDDAD